MAIEIVERFESKFWRGGAIERVYDVYGTQDDLAAIAALGVHEDVPEVYDTVLFREWPPDLKPIGNARGGHWRATVRYSPSPLLAPPATGQEDYSFDIGGATARITESLATTRYPEADAPDTGKRIGVTGKGVVEGIDINVPTSQFGIRKFVEKESVTPAYERLIEEMAWTVNNGTFRGRPAGEVLFVGASGAERRQGGFEDYELYFRFLRRRNRTNLTVGEIEGIDVKGWQHLEVRYDKVKDAEQNELVPRVVGVYVHDIYDVTDFANLGVTP